MWPILYVYHTVLLRQGPTGFTHDWDNLWTSALFSDDSHRWFESQVRVRARGSLWILKGPS